MNLTARALEDDAEHPPLRAQFLEALAVLVFERGAVEVQQRLPTELRWHNRFALVGWLGELIRHLEEQQEGQLLNVLEAREPGVAQHASIAPGPLSDLRCVHAVPGPYTVIASGCPMICRSVVSSFKPSS